MYRVKLRNVHSNNAQLKYSNNNMYETHIVIATTQII